MAALVAERRDWRHLYCVKFANAPAIETVSAIHACNPKPSQVKGEYYENGTMRRVELFDGWITILIVLSSRMVLCFSIS